MEESHCPKVSQRGCAGRLAASAARSRASEPASRHGGRSAPGRTRDRFGVYDGSYDD
jgi:hypothetical protein